VELKVGTALSADWMRPSRCRQGRGRVAGSQRQRMARRFSAMASITGDAFVIFRLISKSA